MVGLNMCDWISCSSPLVLHVPSPYDHCALARKGGPGGLAPRAGGLGGPSAPPGKQGGLGGRQAPQLYQNEFYALLGMTVSFAIIDGY